MEKIIIGIEHCFNGEVEFIYDGLYYGFLDYLFFKMSVAGTDFKPIIIN